MLIIVKVQQRVVLIINVYLVQIMPLLDVLIFANQAQIATMYVLASLNVEFSVIQQ